MISLSNSSGWFRPSSRKDEKDAPSSKAAFNNFDVIRLVLASFVVLVHTYDHTRLPQFALLRQYFSADFAVKGFFIISGYLIYRSFDRNTDVYAYCLKRLARLYPAYCLIVFLCAFASFIVLHFDFPRLIDNGLIEYLACNAVFLNFLRPAIDGVVESNPIPSFNGALWTLKVEVMFYVCVPIIFLIKEDSRSKWLLWLFVISTLFYLVLEVGVEVTNRASLHTIQKQLPGQFRYFTVGMLAALSFGKSLKLPATSLLPCLLLLNTSILVELVKPLLLGCLIFYFAFSFPLKINLRKFGDISYGLYIYHSPLLQLFVGLGIFTSMNPWLGFLLFLAALVTSSYLSWHFLEKRSIALISARLHSRKSPGVPEGV